MNEEEIFNKLKEMISEQFGIDINTIRKESSFIDDLAADSLDLVELVMNIEETYSIEIADEDTDKIFTVEDMVKYIYNNQ